MLKNYTTKITVQKSISEITEFLINAGSISVNQQIGPDRNVVAISFLIDHKGNIIPYKLTPNFEATYKILAAQRKKVNHKQEEKIKEQSARTSWRIIRDWVHAQCALIELEQATPLQLFLSYAYDQKTNKSFYEKIESQNLKLLQ